MNGFLIVIIVYDMILTIADFCSIDKAQFDGIMCKVTHKMLATEFTIIMNNNETYLVWQKNNHLLQKMKAHKSEHG